MKHGLASLRDYDPPQLSLGKAFSRHLLVPSLVEVWPALDDPYDTDDHITDSKNENRCVQGSNESLGNGDT